MTGISRRRFLAASATIGLSGAVLAVSACSSSGSSGSSGKENAAAEATVDIEATAVTVNDPGAEPQEVIAYALSGKREGKMSVTQGFGQASGSTTVLPQLTSTTMTLPFTVDGQTITIGKPTGSNDSLNEDIATAEGFQLTLDSNAMGQHSKATYKAPDGATETARSSVESALGQFINMPIIFPSDPVGIGASWDVRIKINDPSPAVRTITYTLTEREGQRVTLQASVNQKPTVTSLSLSDAPSQSSSAPSTSAGAGTAETLDVKDSSTETSAGTVVVDLTSMVPLSGSIDQTTTTTYGSKTDEHTVVVQKNRRAIAWS